MDRTRARYAWQSLGFAIAVTTALGGCSGGGPGFGSTSQMQRQIEAATAARQKAAKTRAAQSADGEGPAGSHVTKLQKKGRKARADDQATAIQHAIAEQSIISDKLPPAAGKTPDGAAETDATGPNATGPGTTGQTASKPAGSKSKKKKAAAATLAADKPKILHPNGPMRRTSLSFDGSLAATDAEDGSVRLFDVKGGSAIAGWSGPNAKRSALAIDPAHQTVAAASVEGPITLLSYGSKRQDGLDYFARLHQNDVDPTLRGHRGPVNALSFDRDGQQVISAGEDATVRVWRSSSTAPLAIAVGESGCAPAVGPGGKTVAVATADHAVEMLDLDDARRSRRLQRHKAPVSAIVFGRAKDFEVLVSGDEKGRIHVWDLQADRDQEFVGHAAAVTALAFDDTRRRIVSAASDGSLRIAPYPASRARLLAKLPGPPASLALTADQQHVALNVGPASVSRISLAGDGDPQNSLLRGENFTVYAIARDGDVVLAGTAAGSVVAQSRENGAAVGEFTGAHGSVRSLAVHPDGKRFAYSGDDGVIRVARLPEAGADPAAAEAHSLQGHSAPVRSLAFTADGETLVSAGADNMVRLWNLAQRSELDSFPTLGVEPTVVCGTRNAAVVVVACGKKTVLVWNRDARKPASKLPLRGEVRSIALALGGMLATSMSDGDIQLWDLDRQLEIERLAGHNGPVDHLAFAGDTRLVSAGSDKTVRLWSLAPTRVIQAHRGSVRGMAVSQESGRIVTGGEDRRLCFWSPDGELIRDDELQLRITRLALHPRRPQVAFLTDDSFKSSEVARWNLDEAAALEPLHTPAPIKALAYSSDGKKLAVAGTDGMLRVYDSQGDSLLEEIPANCESVRFGADDGHLIAGETDNVVRAYSLRLYRCFKLASPATCAALSPNGEFLLSGAQSGDVRVWSLRSNGLRYEMQTRAHPIAAVSFSGDGKKAFAADLGGTVSAWSVENRSPGQPLASDKTLEHPGAVRTLEISTSGETLLSGCDDGVARVWEVTEAKIKESYAGQALPVVGVRLVDIERSLLACNGNGILNLWKRPTEAEIAKGVSCHLAAAAAKSTDLTTLTPAATNGSVEAQAAPQAAAVEDLLRTARLPAERDLWRKKIQAAADAPPKAEDRPFVSAKLVPRGHVPASEIGKGEPWDLAPVAELQSSFPFDGTGSLRIEMAISSDGRLVGGAPKNATGDGLGTVCIWDVPTAVELRRWQSVRPGRWHALSFAGSNDAFLYTSPDVTAFELSSGKASHFADDCVAVSLPNREQVLFGHSTSPVAASPLLMLIDGGRFSKEWSGLMGFETLVTTLACSRDGRWAAVGVRERLRHKLILFDLQEMQVAAKLDEAPHAKPWSTEGPIGISDAVFSPDGKRLFWHGQYGKDDFRATTAVATPNGFNVPEKSVAKLKQAIITNHVIGYVTGEQDTLYLGTKTGVVLCESKSGKVTNEINLTEMHGVKSEGAETKGGETKGAEVQQGDGQASRVQYAVSGDGAWMASADDGGKVVLWDLTTPKRPCNTFAAHTGPVVGLRFSLDGHWLATAGEENRIRLWNLSELQERRQRQPARKATPRP